MTASGKDSTRARSWRCLAVSLGFVAIFGVACSSDESAAVVWSVNSDATISLCGFDGLRTYQVADEISQQVDEFQSGAHIRFEVEAGTEEDSEPVLLGIEARSDGVDYTC